MIVLQVVPWLCLGNKGLSNRNQICINLKEGRLAKQPCLASETFYSFGDIAAIQGIRPGGWKDRLLKEGPKESSLDVI